MTEDTTAWALGLVSVLPPLAFGVAMMRLHRGAYNGADMGIKLPERTLTRTLESGLGASRVRSRVWTIDRGQGAWELRFVPGGDGPSILRVSRSLPVSTASDAHPAHPRLRFSRETDLHRLGKRLGLSRELQLGDPDFDDTVYVESDPTCPTARRVLSSEPLRRQVAVLVQRGVRSVGTAQIEGEVFGTLYQHSDWGDSACIGRWLDDLDAFVAALPPARTVPARPTAWSSGIARALLLTAWLIAGLVALAVSISEWKPLDDGLWLPGGVLFGAGWVACMLVVLWRVRRRASGIQDLWIAAMFAWMGGIFMAGAGAVTANGLGDPIVDVRLPVIEHRSKQSDDGDLLHYLVIAPPPGARRPVTVRVSREALERTPVGTHCLVHMGQGRLGTPWYTDASCL